MWADSYVNCQINRTVILVRKGYESPSWALRFHHIWQNTTGVLRLLRENLSPGLSETILVMSLTFDKWRTRPAFVRVEATPLRRLVFTNLHPSLFMVLLISPHLTLRPTQQSSNQSLYSFSFQFSLKYGNETKAFPLPQTWLNLTANIFISLKFNFYSEYYGC